MPPPRLAAAITVEGPVGLHQQRCGKPDADRPRGPRISHEVIERILTHLGLWPTPTPEFALSIAVQSLPDSSKNDLTRMFHRAIQI